MLSEIFPLISLYNFGPGGGLVWRVYFRGVPLLFSTLLENRFDLTKTTRGQGQACGAAQIHV